MSSVIFSQVQLAQKGNKTKKPDWACINWGSRLKGSQKEQLSGLWCCAFHFKSLCEIQNLNVGCKMKGFNWLTSSFFEWCNVLASALSRSEGHHCALHFPCSLCVPAFPCCEDQAVKVWSAPASLSMELASSHHTCCSARTAEYSSVSPGFDTVSEDQKIKGDTLKLQEKGSC